MDIFNLAMDWIIKTEGGYVNDPTDQGGETKYGISARQYPNLDIANLTEAWAREIYNRDYWFAFRCDQMPPAIALFAFDALVNHRPQAAARLLQQSINATADGIIGPGTIKRARRADPHTTIRLMALKRLDLYDAIVRSNSSQAKFIDGWRARVLDLYEYALCHVISETKNV